MIIDTLTLLIPPPADPVETRGSWMQVEMSLGTHLPDDFKEFIDVYGSGKIGDFISILNPFSTRPSLNLIEVSKKNLEALRVLSIEFGEVTKSDLFPVPGGILPVALTDNGDVIHWKTTGKPNDWTIVVNEARSPLYEHYNCSLTRFIENLAKGEITSDIFPKSFVESILVFSIT